MTTTLLLVIGAILLILLVIARRIDQKTQRLRQAGGLPRGNGRVLVGADGLGRKP